MLIPEKQSENKIIVTVDEKWKGKVLKQLLKEELNISSRLLTKLKKDKTIKVNNSFARYHTLLKSGDVIEIALIEPTDQFEPENIPIDIVYEDIDLLVINKQPGIVVHPTKSHPNGTIANGLSNYILKNNMKWRIRFVNRLDMDTSGLLIIAKNAFAHHIISEQMKNNLVTKKYKTIVDGVIENDNGTILEPIFRPNDDSIKRIVDKRGQESITKYYVLERLHNATVLEIELLTGRTHQIRVHMDFIGHPITGDTLYNERVSNYINRQALHAWYLKLYQPRFKNTVEITASMPKDMSILRKTLKNAQN
ncbi:RluA family pseudouridine synthase [Serpentinicella sp. ANB-PHB4]|uniref:RluA family pseudouridine synthase n=1 Tax=Serpentinicella sp. ANB-PHB4 TaxID=3074076 RepID=UPI00285DD306|nr:RluA family pseudouridine synthase [Serpentinicella sp. ANB-PHB4]MDR5658336.1 RluA family pseudouridine synthase [Serpentinicella sp. ANB-PHB4]